MARDDSAREQINKLRDKKWVDKRLDALNVAEPGARKRLARAIGPYHKNDWDYRTTDARIAALRSMTDGLDAAGRERTWSALFPRLGGAIEHAWKSVNAKPMGSDLDTPPFRVPGREQVVSHRAAEFVVDLCDILQGLDVDAQWVARHAQDLVPDMRGLWPEQLGFLLAATLNARGRASEEVRQILLDSIAGEHETARFGDHTIVALLNSHNLKDWEAIGRMLLAAQRQEGLRQSILEHVHEAHPDAFRYFIGLVLEHDLARFSSVVRAFDVWFATAWAGGSVKPVNEGLTTVAKCLDDRAELERLVAQGTPQEAYFALWAAAFLDAEDAMRFGAAVIESSADPERRFAAWLIVSRARLQPELTSLIREHMLAGKETCGHIRMLWAEVLAQPEFKAFDADLFAAMGRYYEEMPRKETTPTALLWPWLEFTDEKKTPARALAAIAGPDPMRMLPYAESLDSWDCARFMRHLCGRFEPYETKPKNPPKGPLSQEAVDFVVRMTTDARKDVHAEAFDCLRYKRVPVSQAEVDLLVKNLHRVAATFRKGAIVRLAKLKAAERLAVAERLLGDKHAKRRAAGLELCATLIEQDKMADEARALVETHQSVLTDNETKASAARLLEAEQDAPSTDDCFGLLPPDSRMKPIEPENAAVAQDTATAKACLKSLAALFRKHSDTEIEVEPNHEFMERGRRDRRGSHFPSPRRGRSRDGADPNANLENMPLREVWLEWAEGRSADLRDDDGLELLRAWVLSEHDDHEEWWRSFKNRTFSSTAWQAQWAFDHLVGWLPLLQPDGNELPHLAQIAEDRLATFIEKGTFQPRKIPYLGKTTPLAGDIGVAEGLSSYLVESEERTEQIIRIARLEMLALDLKVPNSERGPAIEDFCLAYDAGHFNEHDFTWLLLAPRPSYHDDERVSCGDINAVTGLKPHPALATRPKLQDVAMAVRDRLIDIELTRGERPSPATNAASDIRHAGGAEVLFRLIAAMGKDKLHRGGFWSYSEQLTRPASLSRLISVTAPHESETHDAFTKLYTESGIKPARLLEVAIYAPQWARHAEHALEMPGLEDAAWWIHAHTKQSDYFRDQEFRDIWNSQIHERTSLTSDDLLDGAVDVAWFNETYEKLGAENWQAVQKAAKYASTSGGHKRAELFATAMLGQCKAADLEERIDRTRHQDSLRALGLLPLLKKTAKAETLRRYTLMQEYKRQSRQFGSQRQASEGRAVDIAMQNLARTAGYKDPARLQWAMEADAVADLKKGPVTESKTETVRGKKVETIVTLAINDEGAPEITIVKGEKQLKAIPAKLKTHRPFVELKGRVTELRRQASRMRLSLEEAMCRGDTFSGAELTELLSHPILRPMLERLVFVGDKAGLVGYPEKRGKLLRAHDDAREPVGKNDTLRLAHPLDLLDRGDWHEWQRDCFEAERVQPFKQIFREVYPKTETELGSGKSKSKYAPDLTRRYAGHQVNPRQALALLKARNWAFKPEEGVRRVWHDRGLVAELSFEEHFYTPAEIDGITLESAYFRKRSNEYKRLSLSDVPDVVFSEAMRDLDLVVSVAHMGGVDPEASASTIEMRAALLRETARLLNLDNVRVEGHHAHIDGELAGYALHLGSANATLKPGKALFIVAVHSQYRGRLFLPFADDDPRTAEVLAKTLMLSRDSEIRDPSILQQIQS
ncbi:MAG: DUF5724 domain-containing protein [Phycisphaerales bacterium]